MKSTEDCELDEEKVSKWLLEKASVQYLETAMAIIGTRLKAQRGSITAQLFNTWIASPNQNNNAVDVVTNSVAGRSSGDWKKQCGLLDEGDLFMELIKDISNELNIDVLCHKIMVNVGLLTRADRASLFLTRGPPENRYLAAKLFDVTVRNEIEEEKDLSKQEEILIPFGVGIAGTVAQTKQIINIQDAYQDSRFNKDIDLKTGYKSNAILCVPICNYDDEVIGVAQIINKTDGTNAFTEKDVQLFQRYLAFCGIGIQNAQLFELSVQEFQRNQMLLSLARSIFEEQNNLECLVTKIMAQARSLLRCERCAVYLLDLSSCESSHLRRIEERPKKKKIQEFRPSERKDSIVNVDEIFSTAKENVKFPTVFELRSEPEYDHIRQCTDTQRKDSKLIQIAKYVAATGQVVNIDKVTSWMDEDARCILCMPILNGQRQLIGVAQLINKERGQPFTESDISIFEAFAIFCGLGIHNTKMYEDACKLMAKQKVALECLSYHATASLEDTSKLSHDEIPSADYYNLYSYKFIDFDLSDDDTCKAAIRMFLECGLVQRFQIPYNVLCKWILSVKKNYRPVKYHNWRHALNVVQTMFAMLKTGKMECFMSDLEILGLLVACLCHDLDHRGTNNAFQSKTESPLAILYSTSTMEHHHFDQCVMILNSEGNNIFQALSPDEYKIVMKIVENCILATDLAMYFKKRTRFMEIVENGEIDWQSEEKKEVLCGILMTACDVSAITKPWDVQHKMAKLVADEFFDQGDLEKLQLNVQPVAMMDRERKDELPQMQIGFIDVICLPLYKVLSETFPWVRPLYEGTLENRKHWIDLAEKVEMGLTWIDHDVIEKPIEGFTPNSCSPRKDIEFTVTTLNCAHFQRKPPAKNQLSLDLTPYQTSKGGDNPTSMRFANIRRQISYKMPKMSFNRSFREASKKSNSTNSSSDGKIPETVEGENETKKHNTTPTDFLPSRKESLNSISPKSKSKDNCVVM